MIPLYNRCRAKSLNNMSVEELRLFYHMPSHIERQDIIDYIRKITLHIGCNTTKLQNVCVRIGPNHIYTEIFTIKKNMVFEKIKQDQFGEDYEFYDGKNTVWLRYNGDWYVRRERHERYRRPNQEDIILFNYLRNIVLFIEPKQWYIRITMLNHYLIKDVIRHIGSLLVNFIN